MSYVRRKILTEDIEDSQITTAKIADSAVVTTKIADSAIVTAKLADGAVTPAKISTDFCQAGVGTVDSVETVVSFPVAFPGTPVVVAAGVDVTDVRITYRSPTAFSWVAAALGTGLWIAVYKP